MNQQQQEIVDANPHDWDQLYPGRFLKGSELIGPTAKLTLVISGVHVELLQGQDGPRVKGVLSFRDETRQLPLSKTVGICLREMFGRQLAAWRGKAVTFFQGSWNGEPAVRVWGSPDIDADMKCVIALARRKPTTVTLHRTGAPLLSTDQRSDPAKEASGFGIGERCTEILKLMAASSTLAELSALRGEYITEPFTGKEPALLAKAYARRESQLKPVDAEGSEPGSVPFS